MAVVAAGGALGEFADSLRGYRTQVMGTGAGRAFMVLFNGWYYSWAPGVAVAVAGNGALASGLRVLLIPLFGALYSSSLIYDQLAPVNGDMAAVASGLIIGLLAGALYLGPILLIGARLLRVHRRLLAVGRLKMATLGFWMLGGAVVTFTAIPAGSNLMVGLGAGCMVLASMALGTVLSCRLIGAAAGVGPFATMPSQLLLGLKRSKQGFP